MQTPKISAAAARSATFNGCREWTTPMPSADAGRSICIRASANTSRPSAMRCGGMHMSWSKLIAATSINDAAQARPARRATSAQTTRAASGRLDHPTALAPEGPLETQRAARPPQRLSRALRIGVVPPAVHSLQAFLRSKPPADRCPWVAAAEPSLALRVSCTVAPALASTRP
eukprot:scaffold28748_cov64-Phaeocystis_antarctica.AAC.5